MTTQTDILNQIRDLYRNKSLSIMVGAGFSKNAIQDYPSWNEMLYDLVIDLHKRDIDKEWDLYRKVIHGPYLPEGTFIKNKVDEYISTVGYLDIVSQYIKKKGIREAMDVYIEKHLPYILGPYKDQRLHVLYKGEKKELGTESLSAHKELLTCNWKNVFTTNYDNVLDVTNTVFDLGYKVYTADYHLSQLGKTPGIIKVHGSLAEDTLTSPFEFDNDKSIRYIISKEDYDQYAEKHQAFSYLMRTSLLTNSFLLVGFSGNDPNFLGWLEWMKDILDKDRNRDDNRETEYKVYLLSLGKHDISTERQLFYKNHRICVVDLLSNEIQHALFSKGLVSTPTATVLTGDSLETVDTQHSVFDSFIRFFQYLREGDCPDNNVPQINYDKLWSQVNSNGVSKDLLLQIKSKRGSLYVPKRTLSQQYFTESLSWNKDWDDFDPQFFAIALNDLGILPNLLGKLPEGNVSKLLACDEYKEMEVIQAALIGEETDIAGDTDLDIYGRALYHLYRLDFDRAKEVLTKWDAENEWLLFKGSLLAVFDRKASIELLNHFISLSNNLEYKYRAAVFTNIFSQQFPLPYSYNEYQQANVSSLWDISNAILEPIEKDNEKIYPYGQTDHSITLNRRDKRLLVIAYIVFLAKTGFRVGYGISVVIDNKKWYDIFKRIYEFCPYPCLYYSLQVRDDKLLSRIGQDYAYSKELYNKLPGILSKLLANIKQRTVGFMMDSGCNLAQELFIAVPEDAWFDDFFEIYTKEVLPNIDSINSNHPLGKFTIRVLGLVSKENHLLDILRVTLDHIEEHTEKLSDILYQCNHMESIEDIPTQFVERISKLIDNLKISKAYILFAFFDSCKWLTADMKKSISLKIVNDATAIKDYSLSVIHTLTYLTFNDPDAVQAIKKAILSRNIWDCGIKDGMSSPPSYLALNHISKLIKWNREELLLIFANLETNFSLIEKHSDSRLAADRAFGSMYISILSDMYEFTCLKTPKEYRDEASKRLGRRILNCLERIAGIKLNDRCLYYMDEDISLYIQYVSKLIDANGLCSNQKSVELILERILMMIPKNLNLELSFAEWLLRYHWDEVTSITNQEILSKLRLVLYRYRKMDFRALHLDLPAAIHNLKYIAEGIKRSDFIVQQSDNAIIDYWMNDPNVNRFNHLSIY